MTDQFVDANKMVPITPPPELVEQWWTEFERADFDTDSLVFVATQAARWGADQELEACINAILSHPGFEQPELFVEVLRADRRPKPTSLKKQALECLKNIDDACESEGFSLSDYTDIIRHALEALLLD